ncbi:fimbrial protein [Providencia sp. Je.9.19]|uniref:fimbrial protein n=1 Tax=Providencia sp. Je.9.19 TaxID=3142844 RepID=UPI003DA7BB5B
MKLTHKVTKYSWCLLLLTSMGQADVLVDITATMISPACDIRSEDSSSPLKISFGIIKIDNLSDLSVMQNFPLYISGCHINKDLAIMLEPKNDGSLVYNGKAILATSTDGLGIDISDITGGKVRSLNVGIKQLVYPEKIDATQYRMDLQAQLVNTVPVSQLAVGKFTSTMMVLVTYN